MSQAELEDVFPHACEGGSLHKRQVEALVYPQASSRVWLSSTCLGVDRQESGKQYRLKPHPTVSSSERSHGGQCRIQQCRLHRQCLCRPWKMVMVDQRNHGASSEVKGFHPPHSIQASAGDLLQLVRTKLSGRTPDLLVGHSLGGKTVLELLRQLQDSGQPVPKQVSAPNGLILTC